MFLSLLQTAILALEFCLSVCLSVRPSLPCDDTVDQCDRTGEEMWRLDGRKDEQNCSLAVILPRFALQ